MDDDLQYAQERLQALVSEYDALKRNLDEFNRLYAINYNYPDQAIKLVHELDAAALTIADHLGYSAKCGITFVAVKADEKSPASPKDTTDER